MTENEKPSEKAVKEEKIKEAPQTRVGENIVFIGRKPAMSYVLATIQAYQRQQLKK